MPRKCVTEATCTECDEDEDNYTVTDTSMDMEEGEYEYEVRCSCRETATITLDEEGTSATENVSYENACWNQDEEEDDE